MKKTVLTVQLMLISCGNSKCSTSWTKTPKLRERLLQEVDFILASDPESKIIVVSKYKFMLSVMETMLEEKNINSVLFTGDLLAKEKAKAVAEFSAITK